MPEPSHQQTEVEAVREILRRTKFDKQSITEAIGGFRWELGQHAAAHAEAARKLGAMQHQVDQLAKQEELIEFIVSQIAEFENTLNERLRKRFEQIDKRIEALEKK
jgi:chromosome segregation ATPase